MKKCIKCCERLETSYFNKNKTNADGYSNWCKKCTYEWAKEKRRSIKGLATYIYYGQKKSCKKRNMPLPEYTSEWLYNWLISQELYHDLYNKWKNSDFNIDLVPSVDRKNDSITYTKDNIQLTTWSENRQKYNHDRKSGKSNQQNKAVVQYDKMGNKINQFFSIMEASRKLGFCHSNISRVCLGKGETAYGYIWRFAKN